jgi:hypothetical protein
MSSLSISAAASAALQQVNFTGHRRKAGGNSLGTGASIGALPIGAGQNMLSNALQSLRQTVAAAATPGSAAAVGAGGAVGASGAVSSTLASPAAASSTPAPVTQELQGFLHSLFAALKQDGLSSATPSSSTAAATTGASAAGATPASATTAASATSATTATSATGSAGQYQGSLVSSLQTLIQQLGGTQAGQAGSSTTGQLTDSFSKLTAAAGASGASTTTTASAAQLKTFLSDFLQKLQSGGGQLQGILGSHVNASA